MGTDRKELITNWKTVYITSLAAKEKNSFVIGPFGSDLVQSDYRNSGIPVVFVRDVKRNRFHWISEVFVSNEKAKKLRMHSVIPRDIVITKMGLPPGIAAVYSDGIEPGIITADIIRLRPDLDKVDPIFLCSLLNSHQISKQVHQRTAGQTRPKLTLADYKTIKVSIPPLLEQKKIAQIFSIWDKAIATTEKMIANSQQQKMVLMVEILTGRQRMPTFSSSIWKKCQLGKLFDERTETGHIDLPLVSITREQGVIWRDDVGRKDTSSDDKSKYLHICPGDIGYNTMRMWQGVSALSTIEGIVSPAYTVITPKEEVDGLFMSYLFKLPRTIHNFYRYSQGLTSDTWNLKFRHFKEVTVIIPDLEEQKEIARILQTCDREISGLNAMRETLIREKKALMQQILTGKRRVKVDELAFSEEYVA